VRSEAHLRFAGPPVGAVYEHVKELKIWSFCDYKSLWLNSRFRRIQFLHKFYDRARFVGMHFQKMCAVIDRAYRGTGKLQVPCFLH